MADIKLLVNKKAFTGWKSARVTRGVESVCGSFDLEVSERWAGQDLARPIGEEDSCELKLGNTTVITGYVDRRNISFGASEHSFRVSGRDKAGDLVDCSAYLDKWEYRNIAVDTFIEKVCLPFDIPVTLSEALGASEAPPIQKLSIDPGDSAFEAIERACRASGMLVFSDGMGGIVLARAGTGRCKTALIQGENILAASAEYDATSRFRDYAVLGQQNGNDNQSGPATAFIKGTASDPNVKRASRTLLVRAEKPVTFAQAKKRAEWEATVRAGRSATVAITVQGWTQSNGDIWPVNTLVTVRSPALGVDGDMLISQATYVTDEGGTLTHLTLRDPRAFTPEPTVPKADKASGAWKELAGGV